MYSERYYKLTNSAIVGQVVVVEDDRYDGEAMKHYI